MPACHWVHESSPIGVKRETEIPTLLLLAFCMMMEDAWWQKELSLKMRRMLCGQSGILGGSACRGV